MTLGELVAHLRHSILRDTARKGLWSDEELVRYLNEAQNLFARRTHQLADDTSTFTFLDTEEGTATYALDDRIVFVSEIRHEDGTLLLDRTRKQAACRQGEGRPMIYTLGAAHKFMRFWPTPDGVYTLDLLVARKPLEQMVADDDEPEIEEDYHLTLCDWAAYRALRNNDPEGSNTVAADGFRADWDLRVRDAKRDVFRLRAGDNPTARANWTGKVR